MKRPVWQLPYVTQMRTGRKYARRPEQPSRLSLFFRELWCRVTEHDWQAVSLHETGVNRTGRMCMRCFDAEAHVYRGQYPVPR